MSKISYEEAQELALINGRKCAYASEDSYGVSKREYFAVAFAGIYGPVRAVELADELLLALESTKKDV